MTVQPFYVCWIRPESLFYSGLCSPQPRTPFIPPTDGLNEAALVGGGVFQALTYSSHLEVQGIKQEPVSPSSSQGPHPDLQTSGTGPGTRGRRKEGQGGVQNPHWLQETLV